MSRNTIYWLTMMFFAYAFAFASWVAPSFAWSSCSPWFVGALIIAYLDKGTNS